MVLWLLTATALAAYPTPDRPFLTRTAFLVSPGTVEQELGVRYGQFIQTPTALKWAPGRFVEFRAEADLYGPWYGRWSGLVGVKTRYPVLSPYGYPAGDYGYPVGDELAVGFWFAVAVPPPAPQATQRWQIETDILVTALFPGFIHRLRLQIGPDLVATGDRSGITYEGIPTSAALILKVQRTQLRGFIEGAAVLLEPQAWAPWRPSVISEMEVNGGLILTPLNNLTLDASVGYQAWTTQLHVGAGLTVNYGRRRERSDIW